MYQEKEAVEKALIFLVSGTLLDLCRVEIFSRHSILYRLRRLTTEEIQQKPTEYQEIRLFGYLIWIDDQLTSCLQGI